MRAYMDALDEPRIIVATHGELGRVLLDTAALIAGSRPDMVCLDLAAEESPLVFQSRLEAALTLEGSALVLVDLPGGTPWTSAMRALSRYPNLRVVSGVNLAMVLEVLFAPRDDIEDLARAALDAGRRSIQLDPHDAPDRQTQGEPDQ